MASGDKTNTSNTDGEVASIDPKSLELENVVGNRANPVVDAAEPTEDIYASYMSGAHLMLATTLLTGACSTAMLTVGILILTKRIHTSIIAGHVLIYASLFAFLTTFAFCACTCWSYGIANSALWSREIAARAARSDVAKRCSVGALNSIADNTEADHTLATVEADDSTSVETDTSGTADNLLIDTAEHLLAKEVTVVETDDASNEPGTSLLSETARQHLSVCLQCS